MRKSLIAKIHIAKKELGLDDETYRDVIKQATDGKKNSSSKCTDKQLTKVIELFKAKGWKTKQNTEFRTSNSISIKLIYVLWEKLFIAGAIKTKDKASLDKFVNKYTNISSVQWLDSKDASKIIEILKKWLARL